MNGKGILVSSFWHRPQEKLTNPGRLRLPKELKQVKKIIQETTGKDPA